MMMDKDEQPMFAGHRVEALAGARRGKVWRRHVDLRCVLRQFVGTVEGVDALVDHARDAGVVEYGPFDKPEGVFFVFDGRRLDVYPRGRYVVRDQDDGHAVVWRLHDDQEAACRTRRR